MATKVLADFTGGLNLVLHPSQLKDNEAQILENMEVRPTSLSNTVSYLALSARNGYRRLHTSALGYAPKGLIEWVDSSGNIRLFSGGFKTGDSKFYVDYITSGSVPATVTNVSATSSAATGIAVFMPYGTKLYYTDGNIAWRVWSGSADSASGFTTETKTGVIHKNRAFYGNDVTNSNPHYLWYSNVGDVETVGASSFFLIGEQSDPIIRLEDQQERLLIFKRSSTWALYIAPDPVNSTIIRVDSTKGVVSYRGSLWTGAGETYVMSQDSGLQLIRGATYEPVASQILNFLKGFQNTGASLGFVEDFILLATLSTSTDTYNKRTFIYDTVLDRVYQYNVNLACFCQNRGLNSFNSRLKAMEDDGSNWFFVELDQLSGTVESTIPCVFRTKESEFDNPMTKKSLRYLVINAQFPDTTTAVTVKVYCDGTLKETLTYTPTATGLTRFVLKPTLSSSFGNFVSLRFEYSQDATLASKFAVLSAAIDYDQEQRIE